MCSAYVAFGHLHCLTQRRIVIGAVRCQECMREAGPDDDGWIAVPLDERDDGGELLIIEYCPDCAEREFGSVA